MSSPQDEGALRVANFSGNPKQRLKRFGSEGEGFKDWDVVVVSQGVVRAEWEACAGEGEDATSLAKVWEFIYATVLGSLFLVLISGTSRGVDKADLGQRPMP